MTTFVRRRIVKINNSQGMGIPKLSLHQVVLDGEVEVAAQTDPLGIKPVTAVRSNWDQAFAEMAQTGDDRLLDGDSMLFTTWETNEWTW